MLLLSWIDLPSPSSHWILWSICLLLVAIALYAGTYLHVMIKTPPDFPSFCGKFSRHFLTLLAFFWTCPKITLQLAEARVTHHHSKGCSRTTMMTKYNLPSLALYCTLTCPRGVTSSPVAQGAAGEPSSSNPFQTSLSTKEGPLLSKHHLESIPLHIHPY